jgi:hypothetical protein
MSKGGVLINIIYIAFVSPDHIGVGKKIESQVMTWRALGYHVIIINDVNTRSIFKKYLARYFTLFRYFVLNWHAGAKIYMRQTPELPLYAFMLRRRKFSCEVNADLEAESKNYSIVRRFIVKLFPQNIHNIATAAFYVSSELSKRLHQSEGAAYVFPNSLNALPIKHALPRKLNVVFVGTPQYSWQGFDFFISIVRAMPRYQFHVIGVDSGPSIDNLRYHGALTGNEYHHVMSNMDFAIGTLAFHRAGIMEGSPLKVRDYLAFNLPFVVGYFDSDFSSSEFCLRINTNILTEEIARIERFFDSWRERSIGIANDSEFLNFNREARRVGLICA